MELDLEIMKDKEVQIVEGNMRSLVLATQTIIPAAVLLGVQLRPVLFLLWCPIETLLPEIRPTSSRPKPLYPSKNRKQFNTRQKRRIASDASAANNSTPDISAADNSTPDINAA